MSSQNNCWGLYLKDTANAVPLKHLDFSIKIYQNIAKVIYCQEYFNDVDLLIETEFFFPISPDACFDSFEATFNNTTIKGVVKEKEKAKEEYKQAVEEGRTAAYSEINKETGDIMKVMIGNIPPNTNIKVTYSYIQKLETSLNKFWCFRLFSTLTPRYNNMSDLQDFLSHDVNVLSNYPTVSKKSADAYPWSIQAEIHSPSPITFLKSPSHDIKTTYGNENHTCNVILNPNSKHFPNKDFVLLFSNGRENKIDYLMTPFEDGYCAMVSLLADFEKSSTEDAFNNFVKAKEVENLHSMDTIRGEYIFLIDRSGSMQGDRITMARTSLALFLKSLPKDSYFNVVSFGSRFEFLYPQSKQYSQESIDSSIQRVQGFGADMGGTEIHDALSEIFDTPPQNGYPRFIFLLTDGAVSNTQEVLDLIMENSDRTRTFTIGIGNGCSPELINKGAAYGRGKAEFVTDNSQTFEKVISLLNASLSPCYSDLSLHADNFDAIVKSVSPSPDSIPFLINGQTVTFFLFLRSAAFEGSQKVNLQLRMNDSRTKKHKTIDVVLDTAEAFENEMIPKLGIYDMIKRLETQKDQVSGNKKANDIMWIVKEDLEKTMTEYSLKYGILCKETAFFCEIADNETNTKNVLPARVIVPTTLSRDYPLVDRIHSFGSYWKSSGAAPTSNATFSARPGSAMKKSPEEIYMPVMMKCSAPAPKSSGGFFSGMASGISNAIGSLFSNLGSTSKSAPIEEYKMKRASTLKDSAPAPTQKSILQQQSYALPTISASSSLQSKSAPSGGSYLDVIMKQKFEGCWDSKDTSLQKTILKDSKLSQLPSQIQVSNSSQANAVWITILVLRWLELACQNDRKAWLLIFQKGCDWLKLQGVDYETVKDIGTASIKV